MLIGDQDRIGRGIQGSSLETALIQKLNIVQDQCNDLRKLPADPNLLFIKQKTWLISTYPKYAKATLTHHNGKISNGLQTYIIINRSMFGPFCVIIRNDRLPTVICLPGELRLITAH